MGMTSEGTGARQAPADARRDIPRSAHGWSPTIGNSLASMGSIIRIPVAGATTGGRLAVIEAVSKPGKEPPPHVHEWEDQIFHIIEGRIAFHCGPERFVAEPGNYAIVPQGTPHAFAILTPFVRLVVVASSVDGRPVGLDRHLSAMSEPATPRTLPWGATTYETDDDPESAARLAALHGIRFLSPEEIRTGLPSYRGFGAGAA